MGQNLEKAFTTKYKKKEVVDLQSKQIEDLPPSVGNLAKCKKLLLNSNDLTSLPDEISKVTTLELLDCTQNRINLIPDSISKLSNLLELYLTDNKMFVGGLPDAIGDIPKLQKLCVSGNQCLRIHAYEICVCVSFGASDVNKLLHL